MLKDYMAGALAAVLVLPFAVGCSTNQSVVRGQNPDVPQIVQASHEQASGQTSYEVVPVSHASGVPCDCENGSGGAGPYAGPYHDGTWNGYYVDGDSCDDCDDSGSCCLGDGSCLKIPHNVHWYKYNEPKGLVYPPANQPPAIVQYPYFTHRGPTDFFMK